MKRLHGKNILLGITGGIAAYKSAELTRRLKDAGADVRVAMTHAATGFVTPLTFQALSGHPVHTQLLDENAEAGMGHIELARWADAILIAPASANFIAKLAQGRADDLLSTIGLATEAPLAFAPAMNQAMWNDAATQANCKTLRQRGLFQFGPASGEQACGEVGEGRMMEVPDLIEHLANCFEHGELQAVNVMITAGPTYEPIDPVRFIGNRSSGKQGHAIAAALAAAGAEVTRVTGPTREPDPAGVPVRHIETARQMLAGVEAALPADIAIFAAAVADWRGAEEATQKLKKDGSGDIPALSMTENPDILKTVSGLDGKRPALVIGFAAETENVIPHATEKRARKGCDWLLANDVSPATGTFGGDANTIHLITGAGAED